MKRVILIRHIKSSWSDFSVKDFDRPIQDERKDDARLVADYLKSKDIFPDLIIASTAKRSQQTAALFCAQFNMDETAIVSMQSLYESTKWEIQEAIKSISAENNTSIIICHNPSITEFVNEVSSPFIPNVSTCGCVSLLQKNEGSWEREFYVRPKMLR